MRKKKESEAPERAEKPKKEQKIVYIDDGSTVADMSGTFKKGREPKQRREKAPPLYVLHAHRVRARLYHPARRDEQAVIRKRDPEGVFFHAQKQKFFPISPQSIVFFP